MFIAAMAARGAGSLLFGLRPDDPATFLTAGGLLIFVALLAALLPARRAATLDPQAALRYE